MAPFQIARAMLDLAPALEVLHGAFVTARGFERAERAQISAVSGLRILLDGVQAVLPRLELSDHPGLEKKNEFFIVAKEPGCRYPDVSVPGVGADRGRVGRRPTRSRAGKPHELGRPGQDFRQAPPHALQQKETAADSLSASFCATIRFVRRGGIRALQSTPIVMSKG